MSRLAGSLIFVLVASASIGWFIVSQRQGIAEPPREAFAAGRDAGFDADQAMTYLKDLCKIGPRISGSDGMKKQQDMLKKHFEARGGKVTFQRFTARQKSQPRPTEMANLIVSWNPDRRRRVILCAHYDTRPIADQEKDRQHWHDDFLSANDGGSGIALLMELANHMKDIPTEVGVDFVFFDGEEYIFDPRMEPDGDRYFFGSDQFGKTYTQDRPKYRYIAAVLLDMIAGQNASFPIEQTSWMKAGPLVEQLWTIAAQQKCSAFQTAWGPGVRDDHLALNKANIPAVDIIDFSYPHWHRLTDIPDNCSADSIAQVARVLVVWLQQIK